MKVKSLQTACCVLGWGEQLGVRKECTKVTKVMIITIPKSGERFEDEDDYEDEEEGRGEAPNPKFQIEERAMVCPALRGRGRSVPPGATASNRVNPRQANCPAESDQVRPSPSDGVWPMSESEVRRRLFHSDVSERRSVLRRRGLFAPVVAGSVHFKVRL
jgi:hypothetical protein